MAKRTVNSGIGTYMAPDGSWRFGVQGESVEVQASDVERFDRLNPAAADAQPEAQAEPAPKQQATKPAAKK